MRIGAISPQTTESKCLPDPANQLHVLHQRAELHASRKEWQQAAACFKLMLDQKPGDPGVLVQLSYIESLAGHYRAARDYALRAHGARPRDPAVIGELVARLRTFNAAEALHECIDGLKPFNRVPIPLLLACAAQYSYLNEQERALALLDEAFRGDPDYPATLMARGQVLMYLGRFDESETDVLRCVKRAPELAQPWWLLSRLRKQTATSNHVAQIKVQLQRPGRKPGEIALLADALHKELDDLGDYPGAWAALEQACRAKRATLVYRAEDSRALVSALIGLPTVPPMPSPAIEDSRIPVFIVGMHRSGTTLLEQLLDGHSDVHGVGELYDFTSQMRYATDHHCRGVIDATIVERARGIDFAAIGSGYLKGMEWRLGEEKFFTDKLPSNFLNLGFICRALPQARILHMVRDPIETCFSNLRELFSEANPYSYDQLELADYYKQYQRLMAHWHAAFPGRILDVDYAALTKDPEAMLREVTAFCGLDFQPEMLQLQERKRGVATASAVQVRGQVISRGQPKWAPYEEHLQPLIRSLLDSR
jgi:tetratricopeptide (TPR) repeat protein